MVEFTYQQKIALMRILLDIIHADGRIDARETFFFNKLKEELELTDDDHAVVENKNSLIALTQVRLFDEEQKNYFAKLMGEMIIVDEDINANEITIFEVVADFCNIKSSFEDIIDDDTRKNCSNS